MQSLIAVTVLVVSGQKMFLIVEIVRMLIIAEDGSINVTKDKTTDVARSLSKSIWSCNAQLDELFIMILCNY